MNAEQTCARGVSLYAFKDYLNTLVGLFLRFKRENQKHRVNNARNSL